jgi:hypothetical protein
MSRVICVGDPHEPVSRKGYLRFCKKIHKKYNCNKVVILGDIADWHGISFHSNTPDAPGVDDEYSLTYKCIHRWHKAFPKATVTIGNHDERVLRLAESVNIPAKFIRDYKEIWDTPKWEWVYDTIIDDVYYFHGVGSGGLHPAYNTAKRMSMSVVQGHVHSAGGIKWLVSPKQRWFGMDTGCGVDDDSYAMAYNRHSKRKSVIGCGVVIDGNPYYEIMPLEKY